MPRQIGPRDPNSKREQSAVPQSPVRDSGSLDETRRIEPIGSMHADPVRSGGQGLDNYVMGGSGAAEAVREEPVRKKRTGLWITLVVLAAAACMAGYFWITSERAVAAYDDQTQILDDGTYYEGVSIMGQDVGGMTMDEARPVISQKVQSDMDAMSVVYKIQEDQHELNAQQLGAAIDVETLLHDALAYGRSGTFEERQKQIQAARETGTDFVSPYSYSQETVTAAVEEVLAPLEDTAKDAQVEIRTTSDEGSKTTGYSIEFTDEQSGIGVEEDKLIQDIMAAATSGAKNPVEAQITTREPQVTREELEAEYTVRGTYSTEYGSSAEGRRYNIWKMADIINGVRIDPGETWSINEEAGPRTYDLGWKGAPGISNGAYKEEAGGGICQVSSTLYNAVLRSEVTVAERTHHSWPLSYVPGGLDATISTGAPDFKITNNLDKPIFIATQCDGEGDRTVRVSIIGPAIGDGLTRDFYSELVKTTPAGSAITVSDSSLPAGTRQTIIGAHEGKTYNIYKRLLDENGDQVGETELYMVDTYAPKPAQIRVGTGSRAAAEPSYSEPEAQSEPDPEPAPEVSGGGGDEDSSEEYSDSEGGQPAE